MHTDRHPATGTETATILVSFELSQKEWLITLRQPDSAKLSRHSLSAGDIAALDGLLRRQCQMARRTHGSTVAIASIQEAGLDGFWLHRWLEQHGVASKVVDAASIAAPRRKRRAKSDGIDGETLLRVLAAWRRGEPRVCSMVEPVSVEIEDDRRLTRERERLLGERVALTNRIGGLLLGQGVRDYQPLRPDRHAALAELRTGDGRELPHRLHDEISRMLERIELLNRQIATIEAEREALLRQAGAGSTPDLLLNLRGIGPGFASADMPGFQRGRKLTKVGRRAQDTAELFFESVAVPVENLIGEEGRGLHHLMRNLAQERLSIATTAAANAERALEITLDHVRSRNAFGQPIGSFQANRFSLADLATTVSMTRVYIDRCLEAHVHGQLSDTEAAKAKLWSTELEFQAVDLGMQLHGGYGYMEEYEIARRWRDARVERIYGGTSEIMKEIIGRSLGL